MQHETAKTVVDVVSLSTIAMSLLDRMPAIAALAAFIWTLIRIYETKTVQGLVAKLRGHK